MGEGGLPAGPSWTKCHPRICGSIAEGHPLASKIPNPARGQEGKGGGAADAASALQHSSEQLEVLGESGILCAQFFDLAHRMHHRRVVTAAELAADLRQRA